MFRVSEKKYTRNAFLKIKVIELRQSPCVNNLKTSDVIETLERLRNIVSKTLQILTKQTKSNTC